MFRSVCLGLVFCVSFAGAAGLARAQSLQELTALRYRMVDDEISGAGVKNARVIDAMKATLRHEFVPLNQRKLSYYDMALPIGHGQTISPPFVVAYMTEQLDPLPTDRVLEIGTGSGYQAAVLSPLVAEVYSIEIVEPLGRNAEKVLKKLKYRNVFTKVGDGYQGWPDKAPFDKIIVTCSPENVPQPLVEQLKEGGRMVIPLGERYQQSLYLYRKENGKLVREALLPTLFVPMTGAAESERKVQPDPTKPVIVNNSFEESTRKDGTPDGWHYVRQGERLEDATAPEGDFALYFSNANPGRGAQALQGFALDGRAVKQLNLSAWIKLKDVNRGETFNELPALHVMFFDENRGLCGQDWVGTWFGTTNGWEERRGTVQVPTQARSAILRLGLLGGTGQIWIDRVRMEPVAK